MFIVKCIIQKDTPYIGAKLLANTETDVHTIEVNNVKLNQIKKCVNHLWQKWYIKKRIVWQSFIVEL